MADMSAAFPDHFSRNSADYAAHRPTYPPQLIEWLAGIAPARTLAWDCGTGNGQAALALAAQFDRVIATDASAEQLASAARPPRVEYRVALAEDSGIGAGTVDLVTVAQALHWFDVAAFHREASRVLKPEGVIAEWCYGLPRVDAAVDACIDAFYRRVGRYWPPQRSHILTGYRDLEFPFPRVDAPAFTMGAMLDRRELIGYVGTWSAVARARSAEGVDPVPELDETLAPVWPDACEKRAITRPFTVRVGRRS